MKFMSDEFMLRSDVAKRLFKDIKDLPIFDYHCHLNPKDIYEDQVFDDITEVWLGGDHYKWRLMRANGIEEAKITGQATNKEKFQAWIQTLSDAYGNPLYHWSHLELYRIFGITEAVQANQWETLYQQMNDYIKNTQLSPRKLIAIANVKFIGTTDHPLDDLNYHQLLKAEENFTTTVAPTFRPDEAFVEHANFNSFVERLANKTGTQIDSFSDFMRALEDRIKYFGKNGCLASDHSLADIDFLEMDLRQLDVIMAKALNKQALSHKEIIGWQSMLMVSLCKLYKEQGWVTQIHFGALRSQNTPMRQLAGPDSGFDSMKDQSELAVSLNSWLNYLATTDSLPQMVMYNLNPTYNDLVANTLANFQANEQGLKSPLQFGAAWWFADTERGMINQLDSLADQGLLANFIGMLTDSRSFLSYQRHDYFRRILANYIAKWVEEGKVPEDYESLRAFAERIAYKNAYDFFDYSEENK